MSHKAYDLNASGKRVSPLSLYLDIVLAVCAALALVMDMNVRSGNNYINMAESLPNTPAVTVLFAVILFARRKANGRLPEGGAGTWCISLFLGFWWVLAVSVRNTMNVNQPFLSSGQMLKTVIVTVGMAGLYELLFRTLVFALEAGAAWRPRALGRASVLRGLASAYERQTFWVCTLVILLAWLPHFVIAYPCAMNSDSVTQLRQWTGMHPFSTHHPPFGTLLIGLAYEAGLLLGDGSYGLALYVAVQMMLCAAVLGYLQDVMRRLGAPLWLRLLALFAACLCPVYADNMTTIIKDVPYACGMLLLLCETVVCLFLRERTTPAGALRFIVGGVLVMLMRNNGRYVLIPLMVCLIVWAVKKPRVRMAAACAVAASVIASTGVNAWLVSAYDIAPGSSAEALSLPFQQTARFVHEHEAQIPPNEYEAIEAVLGMSGLGNVYDPTISDPVKARFREEATAQDMQRYFAVWFKQFLRDPACYVKATLIQNVLLFDPQTYNLALFDGTGLNQEHLERLHITETNARDGLRDVENNLRRMLMALPGMAQLNSLGFHCCILLFACFWAARNKQGRLLICLLPMLISMMVIVAGPCIQNQDRYGFPIVYCMPLMLSCMSHVLSRKKECCEVSL